MFSSRHILNSNTHVPENYYYLFEDNIIDLHVYKSFLTRFRITFSGCNRHYIHRKMYMTPTIASWELSQLYINPRLTDKTRIRITLTRGPPYTTIVGDDTVSKRQPAARKALVSVEAIRLRLIIQSVCTVND